MIIGNKYEKFDIYAMLFDRRILIVDSESSILKVYYISHNQFQQTITANPFIKQTRNYNDNNCDKYLHQYLIFVHSHSH